MARHVVLVGLMGSGKTTVGRRLAARLDRPFVDADAALEAIADRSVAEIFAQDGEAAFRALEADTLAALLEHHEPCVIASGGGLVLRADNRARLRRPDVTVVFLDAGPAFLASRVAGKTHRPLLAATTRPSTCSTRLHAERAPLYAEVADITVSVEPFHAREEKPKQALAERIADLVVGPRGPGDGVITVEVALRRPLLPRARRPRRPPRAGRASCRPARDPGRHRHPGRASASRSTPGASTGRFAIADGEAAKTLATVEDAVPRRGRRGASPAPTWSSPSAAGWSPTWPGSPPPSTTAASRSCTCPRRCSAWSTPPSAARPA